MQDHTCWPITSCSASPIIRFLAACGGASKPLSEKETRWKNNLCVPRTQNAQKMKAPLSYATLALPFSVAKTTWKYIQPNIYRAPEVILKAPWTYSVDIWNVGCMILDIFEGDSLFTGQDPEFQTYRSRAHIAEMISLLGPPPPRLLAEGRLSHNFFSDKGDFCAGISLRDRTPLEERETSLEGQDKVISLYA